jgi:Mn-containing catalase
MLALDDLSIDSLQIGSILPTPELVDQYFNDSTGDGDGAKDMAGPWKDKNAFRRLDNPAFHP